MKSFINKYKIAFSDNHLFISIPQSIIMLIVVMYINYHIGLYAFSVSSNPVTDIILSNFDRVDVTNIFTFGILIFMLFTIIYGIYYPEKVPFIIKSIALFIIIRAFFVSLTHIGPFLGQDAILSGALSNLVVGKLSFGADLFFSGHTGVPFLMALIFWKEKILRYLFLFSSIAFGIIVLIGHIHYTIDVVSAFFITPTIYIMSKYIFKKDYAYFNKE